MWWGGFSEKASNFKKQKETGLNPHVVGRFFRVCLIVEYPLYFGVLIPMWWGGFSE